MPDIERTVTNEIVSFMHCRMCLDERPSNLSPREYGDLEVGFTNLGFQIWCKRHEVNVLDVDFAGAGPFPGNQHV